MPQKTNSRRLITPLLLFTLAGWALWALGRNTHDEPAETPDTPTGPTRQPEPTPAPARERVKWNKRRLATSLAFATLFFGGAAFSAGAGDVVAEAIEGDTTTEVASSEEAPAEEAPADEAPAEETPAEEAPVEPEAPAEPDAPAEDGEPTEEPADSEQPAEGGSGSGGDESGGGGQGAPAEPPADGGSGGGSGGPATGGGSDPEPQVPPGLDEGEGAPAPSELPVLDNDRQSSPELDPEADAAGFLATIWIHRTLPDPTPPASRLDGAFAQALEREAEQAGVDWAVVLAVLRLRGFDGGSMNLAPVRTTARRLAELGADRDAWGLLLAYGGRTVYADRALALTHYNRAVGLDALVMGLQAAKPDLQASVLADRRLDVYAGGRLDIAMGRTDVRVLVLLRYLAEAHGQVTVSSLTNGHRVFSRPGVVSAHTYGLAVDVAALEGTPIVGNQQPGGVTERAVRNILLLPSELQPKQVISLLGLGGPSFPLADHGDHIHVGF
jgi:hypothetical protein